MSYKESLTCNYDFYQFTDFYNLQIPSTKRQTNPNDPKSKFDSTELVAGQTKVPQGFISDGIITGG